MAHFFLLYHLQRLFFEFLPCWLHVAWYLLLCELCLLEEDLVSLDLAAVYNRAVFSILCCDLCQVLLRLGRTIVLRSTCLASNDHDLSTLHPSIIARVTINTWCCVWHDDGWRSRYLSLTSAILVVLRISLLTTCAQCCLQVSFVQTRWLSRHTWDWFWQRCNIWHGFSLAETCNDSVGGSTIHALMALTRLWLACCRRSGILRNSFAVGKLIARLRPNLLSIWWVRS